MGRRAPLLSCFWLCLLVTACNLTAAAGTTTTDAATTAGTTTTDAATTASTTATDAATTTWAPPTTTLQNATTAGMSTAAPSPAVIDEDTAVDLLSRFLPEKIAALAAGGLMLLRSVHSGMQAAFATVPGSSALALFVMEGTLCYSMISLLWELDSTTLSELGAWTVGSAYVASSVLVLTPLILLVPDQKKAEKTAASVSKFLQGAVNGAFRRNRSALTRLYLLVLLLQLAATSSVYHLASLQQGVPEQMDGFLRIFTTNVSFEDFQDVVGPGLTAVLYLVLSWCTLGVMYERIFETSFIADFPVQVLHNALSCSGAQGPDHRRRDRAKGLLKRVHAAKEGKYQKWKRHDNRAHSDSDHEDGRCGSRCGCCWCLTCCCPTSCPPCLPCCARSEADSDSSDSDEDRGYSEEYWRRRRRRKRASSRRRRQEERRRRQRRRWQEEQAYGRGEHGGHGGGSALTPPGYGGSKALSPEEQEEEDQFETVVFMYESVAVQFLKSTDTITAELEKAVERVDSYESLFYIHYFSYLLYFLASVLLVIWLGVRLFLLSADLRIAIVVAALVLLLFFSLVCVFATCGALGLALEDPNVEEGIREVETAAFRTQPGQELRVLPELPGLSGKPGQERLAVYSPDSTGTPSEEVAQPPKQMLLESANDQPHMAHSRLDGLRSGSAAPEGKRLLTPVPALQPVTLPDRAEPSPRHLQQPPPQTARGHSYATASPRGTPRSRARPLEEGGVGVGPSATRPLPARGGRSPRQAASSSSSAPPPGAARLIQELQNLLHSHAKDLEALNSEAQDAEWGSPWARDLQAITRRAEQELQQLSAQAKELAPRQEATRTARSSQQAGAGRHAPPNGLARLGAVDEAPHRQLVQHGREAHGPPGHGPPGHAPLGHGTASHGTASHDTASHGPPGHGPPGHGPPGHGLPGYGPPGHGTASHGPPGHGHGHAPRGHSHVHGADEDGSLKSLESPRHSWGPAAVAHYALEAGETAVTYLGHAAKEAEQAAGYVGGIAQAGEDAAVHVSHLVEAAEDAAGHVGHVLTVGANAVENVVETGENIASMFMPGKGQHHDGTGQAPAAKEFDASAWRRKAISSLHGKGASSGGGLRTHYKSKV